MHRVTDRMNDLFMEIVGGNPEFEAGVFTRVYIDDDYNIKVDTHDGRTLDTDFELNGASQRALTLSFIWALMEVSGTTAPRIIDTPLGMVAGGVKTRMVDVITKPGGSESPDFQVVLLLTRSEIRDVEELLDKRAGLVRTLSNSKDYPEDLVYAWNVEHPVSRLCAVHTSRVVPHLCPTGTTTSTGSSSATRRRWSDGAGSRTRTRLRTCSLPAMSATAWTTWCHVRIRMAASPLPGRSTPGGSRCASASEQGQRTKLPEKQVKFNDGDILATDPWRITQLELLTLSELGIEALETPRATITMADRVRAHGLRLAAGDGPRDR